MRIGRSRGLSPLSPVVHAWIERSAGPDAQVVAVESLPTSATAKHRITVVGDDGARRQLLLRSFHDAARRANDPWYVPSHEARVLTWLAPTRVPAPRLFAADLDASICDAPALLESWLPGRAEWRPLDLERFLRCTAEALVAIHAVALPQDPPLPLYAPYEDRRHAVSPPFTTRPGLWERVAAVLRTNPPAFRERFIHRDYYPGNVLVQNGAVTGVVDWATAARGPAGIDLARLRLNLAGRLGPRAAAAFLPAYAAAGGDPTERHPYWDLLDAADAMTFAGASPPTPELRNFEDWVASVLAEIES